MTVRRKRLWLAAAVLVPVLGAGVLAHTRAGRALFGEKCPWEGAPPSAERLESFRVKSAANLKGTARAPARPAFGFVLDSSTKADVTAWGARVGATCREEIAGAALRCESTGRAIGADSELPVKDAFFRFDPRGVLVGVDLMRDGTNGDKAAAVLTTITAQIAREAGPPSTVQGTASSAHLAGYLNRAGSEFRFADYAADVSATNMGEQGVVVREQYRSIPN
jgi:hypothetical protein